MTSAQQTDKERLNILVVDDDRITLKFVRACLSKTDEFYNITTSVDVIEALDIIRRTPPDILITDWMMPNMSGPELCRQVRATPGEAYIYLILLTAKSNQDDILTGLSSGADDYIVKPFDQQELRSRVMAGARIMRANKALRCMNEELKKAFSHIRTLHGLLPICVDCKKVRQDAEYWEEVQKFISKINLLEISDSLCPECMQKRLLRLL